MGRAGFTRRSSPGHLRVRDSAIESNGWFVSAGRRVKITVQALGGCRKGERMVARAGQTALVDQCIRDALSLQVGWRRLRDQDREDVIQTAHLFLCEFLGEDYMQRIADIIPFSSRGTSEHNEVTRQIAHAISRAIGKHRWTSDKRRQRGLAREVSADREPSVTVSSTAAKLINWEIDLSQGIADLGELEREVWHRLVQRKTTRHIGQELGIDFRRVAKIRKKIIRVLSSYLD
jgi:hypothetical protein